MTNPRPNPYPGPRSFQRGEQLYGRERETAELLDLLIAERIVLFASPSGAGKTSLVQAALIPVLEDEGFLVLPTMHPGRDTAVRRSNFGAYQRKGDRRAVERTRLQDGRPAGPDDGPRVSPGGGLHVVAEWPLRSTPKWTTSGGPLACMRRRIGC